MFSRATGQAQETVPPGGGLPGPPLKAPDQRRFDRLFVAVTLAVLAAVVAGLLVWNHARQADQARAQVRAAAAAKAKAQAAQVDAVKQAYLAYWSALDQAYQQMSVAPLASVTTPDGAAQEDKTMQSFRQTGYRYHLTADPHDMQVVIYSGGQVASIDDNLVQHLTRLDPATLQSVASEQLGPVHGSAALRLQNNGRWLVDSYFSFGSDGTNPGAGISYAAISRDTPLDPGLRSQIEQGYLTYWQAVAAADQRLDPTLLQGTVLEPTLDTRVAFINKMKAQHQGYRIQVEHNYRIALKDPSTAYVYDTLADSSFSFDPASGRSISPEPTTIMRESFELKRAQARWKVDLVALYS